MPKPSGDRLQSAMQWPARLAGMELLLVVPATILIVTAAYLVIGLFALAAWWLTGNDAWVLEFFRVPGALLLVSLAGAELLFSVRVANEFSPGQPLRRAWQLIAMSAGCDLLGSLGAQVLSADSALNPLQYLDGWSSLNATDIRDVGLIIGGTFRFALLAAGLVWALQAYRKSGFLAQFRIFDRILLALVAAYIVREFWDLSVALRHGKVPGIAEALGWPVDPLLVFLIAEAILLYRSAQHMGKGRIGRCWKALSVGVGLVALGDIAIWATNYGYLPWPWSAVGWYIWLPAAGAFALAPAYQLEAIYLARSSRASSPLTSLN